MKYKNKNQRLWWEIIGVGIVMTLSVPALAASVEQKLQTLKLIKVHESKEELRTAHPDLFPPQAIHDEGDSIVFSNPNTRQVLKQLRKKSPEVLREEQHDHQTFVIKKTYDYRISPHQSLVMAAEYEGRYLKGTDMSEAGPQPQKRLLYNRSGEVITELLPLLNYLEDSPDHNYFAAAHSGEVGADFLYFYDIQGNLLKKYAMNKEDIGFKYSTDSQYVKVDTSSFESQVYLFSKTGDILGQFDYRALFHENLFNFYVSDDAQLLLFSMFKNAYLLSNDGKILWQQPYLRILDCRFIPEKNSLILFSMIDNKPLNESRKSITIVSLGNGKLLDIIEDIELMQFTQQGVVVKKEGRYYDYTVR